MKRIIFLLAVLLTANGMMADHYYMIPLKSGKELKGEFVSMTDSTATFVGKDGKEFVLNLSDFVSVYDFAGTYYLVDGKVVSIHSSEGRAYHWAKGQEKQAETIVKDEKNLDRPNLSIGREMARAGGICIGVGAPLLVGGAVLTIVSYKTPNLSYSNLEKYYDEIKSLDACRTSGIVLLSVGGALTIAGFPIMIGGRNIMDIELQYTGAGAGVAVKW